MVVGRGEQHGTQNKWLCRHHGLSPSLGFAFLPQRPGLWRSYLWQLRFLKVYLERLARQPVAGMLQIAPGVSLQENVRGYLTLKTDCFP